MLFILLHYCLDCSLHNRNKAAFEFFGSGCRVSSLRHWFLLAVIYNSNTEFYAVKPMYTLAITSKLYLTQRNDFSPEKLF